MNIVSSIVGISIMGAAAPSMMTMSIAPFEAQKRAQNLGVAESAAVIYAAENEGKTTLTAVPDVCDLDSTNAPAYEITCSEGDGAYEQTVSRSFSQVVQGTSPVTPVTPDRTFSYPINPYGTSGIECHDYENWGTAGVFRAWNVEEQVWTKESCTPPELRTQVAFDDSDPAEWIWDINGRERGNHSSY
jgi:type II secretory pathway pseudopilin PulG